MTITTEAIVTQHTDGHFYLELSERLPLHDGDRLLIEASWSLEESGSKITSLRIKNRSVKSSFQTSSHQEWLDRLLTVSVWFDEDEKGIQQAREYINQWQPQNFF